MFLRISETIWHFLRWFSFLQSVSTFQRCIRYQPPPKINWDAVIKFAINLLFRSVVFDLGCRGLVNGIFLQWIKELFHICECFKSFHTHLVLGCILLHTEKPQDVLSCNVQTKCLSVPSRTREGRVLVFWVVAGAFLCASWISVILWSADVALSPPVETFHLFDLHQQVKFVSYLHLTFCDPCVK